jgi:hypothetical protein
MNESAFIQSIHHKLPKTIYRWKISDRFSSGVADAYYSTPKTDLWVEYKYYPQNLPKNVTPNLSRLQIKWLHDRHTEGRNVYVIVGSPSGCLIYENLEWTKPKSRQLQIPREELIEWLKGKLCTN